MEAWQSTSVTILGLSRSGSAVARHIQQSGGRSFISETAPATPGNEALRQELSALGVELEMGGHTQKCFTHADLVVVSPGIPPHAEIMEQLRLSGKEIISEVELAYRETLNSATKTPIVGITGTNGKSTTTTLISRILTVAGHTAPACGNIGIPLISCLENHPDYLVTELSSFQLQFSPTLRAKVAVFLNLTPDHLDWHGSLDAYRDAKLRLFTGIQSPEWSVVNAEDAVSTLIDRKTTGKVLWFSPRQVAVESLGNVAYLDVDGQVTIELEDQPPTRFFNVRDLQIIGDHNHQNVLASVAATYLLGVAPEVITRACLGFEGLEHRMERVATIDGVIFYNDSKATNVDAATCALNAFGERPVVLIAGGKDKLTPLEDFAELVKNHTAYVVLLGEAAERFALAFQEAGLEQVEIVESLGQAIESAFNAAQRFGSIPVLFSPACASFGMFNNFEHRGEVFKQLVRRLKEQPATR